MHIQQLGLYARDVERIAGFYGHTLGLPVERHDSSVTVVVGSTRVTFQTDPSATPYHFAFNIPPDQAEAARSWLRSRVDPLPYNGKEIVDFPDWNARAIYFYDPAQNIVECIARKNLATTSAKLFSWRSLMAVSEIGIAPDSIEQTYHWLHRYCALDIYDGSFESFCAIGDEHGMLITVNRKRKRWFPTDETIHPSPLSIQFAQTGKTFDIAFDGHRLRPTDRAFPFKSA